MGVQNQPLDRAESPWPVTVTVMLATLMVILDMTIVNVSLPHMMGSLGATSEQITWVLTSYIVAEGVMIPLSGYLADRFGRRRVIIFSIFGFVVSSALCGQAGTLQEIVIFRILQGMFGAPVIPLSQSTLVDSFPGAERGKAMAIFGLGVLLGPALGPTLGGYITENMNWRWVFYVNVPVGIINLMMAYATLKKKDVEGSVRSVDWLGALFMAVGVGTLQYVIDRGNHDDWFESRSILAFTVISTASLIIFVARSWRRDDAILRVNLLMDRNLATACFLMMAFGLALFGTIVLQPIMLQDLMGYPPETTGLIMAPRAICNAFTMALVATQMHRVGTRPMVVAGMIIMAIGSYMMSRYNLYISPYWALLPGLVQGLGMGMVFVPLATIAFETIDPKVTDQASALFNLMRTLGASIGISIVTTLLSRGTQVHWNRLGGHIYEGNPNLDRWLDAHNMTLDNPMAIYALTGEVAKQAAMLAFVNDFLFIAVAMLALTPLVLFVKSTGKPLDLSAMH